ncbi:MAG: carboxypeptidase-like regulatory domain-containing protein, partial [Bacteroidales bacterium]|nr:carboxypeptidase-like regulatory domain-containing protein [Bacteroidales bacterium]
MFLSLFCGIIDASAQNKQFRGTVTDDNGQSLPGVTVYVQGTANGTITDLDGEFQISTTPGSTLVFSFVGYETVTMQAADNLKVTMHEETAEIAEVVVVGYGQQKKASVVGSITQTDAKTLDRHSGVPSLGAALTGNLPGVITSTSTGMPGEEDPKIIIRTQTSWNNSDPLVLVDGIERPMNSVDISSVESISVLKDASATAVYGVKGANGVILITTKRGQEGKAQVHVKANTTVKVVSKLPAKYDSYNTFLIKNDVIMREAAISPTAWGN